MNWEYLLEWREHGLEKGKWEGDVKLLLWPAQAGHKWWCSGPLNGQVSGAYEHMDGAKGVSSTTMLAHRFPPPLLKREPFLADWVGHRQVWVCQSMFISRLGDCASGPQQLIYICTWNWLNELIVCYRKMNECKAHADSMPSLPVQRYPSILEMARSEDVPHFHSWQCLDWDWVRSQSVIKWNTHVSQFCQVEPWWSMTVIGVWSIFINSCLPFYADLRLSPWLQCHSTWWRSLVSHSLY